MSTISGKSPHLERSVQKSAGDVQKNASGLNDLGKMLSLCSERGFRFNWGFGAGV